MLAMKIKKLSRHHVCSVPGCRCRDTFFFSRRNDANGSPLYLCRNCIEDIHGSLKGYDTQKTVERAKEELKNSFDSIGVDSGTDVSETGEQKDNSADEKSPAEQKEEREESHETVSKGKQRKRKTVNIAEV